MRRLVLPLLAALAVTACSSHGDQPSAVSEDQARQLNDAAAMLDANSMDANATASTDNESDTQ